MYLKLLRITYNKTIGRYYFLNIKNKILGGYIIC